MSRCKEAVVKIITIHRAYGRVEVCYNNHCFIVIFKKGKTTEKELWEILIDSIKSENILLKYE